MLRGLQARSYPDTLEIEEGYIHVAITKCWLDCRYCVFDCLCYSLPAGAGCHCTEKTQCFMALFWLWRIDFLSLPSFNTCPATTQICSRARPAALARSD